MVVPLVQENGEICTGQVILQPISLKSDRLLELGRLTGVAMPTITAIYQASKLLAHVIETEKVAVRSIELPQV